MEFVSESVIDKTIAVFEELGEEEMSIIVEQFSMEQPAIINFMMSDDVAPLSSDERQIMLFLSLVIWKSMEVTCGKPIPTISMEMLSDEEENNWDLLESESDDAPFFEKISVLYENHTQEDILVFIEDSIAESEEAFDPNSREPMFVILKTIVDSIVLVTNK